MQYSVIYVTKLFSEKIQPHDTIWLIGEDFVEETARRCFVMKKEDAEFFTHTKFGVKCFGSNSFRSCFLTTIVRVRNNLANALKEIVTPIPKMVFIMLEDDVVKELGDVEGLPHIYGRCIEWLHHEIRKQISAHIDALPKRAQREPYIVWILPSRHMNYCNDSRRELFAECIENILQVHDNKTFALPLKQNWDQYDPSIFLYDSQRYSASGLDRLWDSSTFCAEL